MNFTKQKFLMKRKILSLLLALVISLTLLPLPMAQAADDDSIYQPNPMCGECLGKTAGGAYEFNITIPDDRENQPTPLLPGHYYSTVEITNTGASAGSTKNIIYTRAQYFYGCAPGTADITYSASRESSGPKKPVAVVHVTVLSKEDYDAYMDSSTTPPAQDHTHVWYYHWSNPSCKFGGEFYRECNRCRTKETLKTAPATGHRYTETITRQPTAQWEGIRQYECTDCGDKYTENIPKLDDSTTTPTQPDASGSSTTPSTNPVNPGNPGNPGGICQHVWKVTEIAATCTKLGQSVQTCTICGELEVISTTPALKHSYVAAVTVPATAERAGVMTYTCSRCQDSYTEAIPQQGTAQPGTATPGTQGTPETPSKGSFVTGALDMPQLSKQEIIDLLAATPTTFSGQIFDVQPNCAAPYAAGKLSDAALQAMLNRLNALRRIAGMPATQLDKTWCESAQYGAVILGSIGKLNHTPSQPSDMSKDFYDKAYAATNSSNLSSWHTLILAVDSWMDDYGAGNIEKVGHRRWQLSPALDKVGFGYVDNGKGYGRYAAEKVFERGNMSAAHSVSYDSFGWPSAGYFPNDTEAFDTTTAWSVSLNPNIYAAPSGVTVHISGGGNTWTLSGSYTPSDKDAYLGVTAADNWNYGGNHIIIFRPAGVTKYEGIYTVEIQGLKAKKDNSSVPFTYQVEFFSTSQSTAPNTTTTPSTTPSTSPNPTTTPTNPSASGTNPFTDVGVTQWFYPYVKAAYEAGLVAGTTATTYSPGKTLTLAESVTLAARIYAENHGETAPSGGTPWYSNAYYYCVEKGVIDGKTFPLSSMSRTATRYEMVVILDGAVPSARMDNSVQVPDGKIPDVRESDVYGEMVYRWYRAGIVAGDTDGSFYGNRNISRSEVAKILCTINKLA